MTDRETRKAELIAMMAAGKAPTTPKSPRAPRAKPAPAVSGNMIAINGGVAAGQVAGGDIHNHSYAQAPRPPKVTVLPSRESVSEAQKVALLKLRDEWIALNNAIKAHKLTIGGAQKAINDQALVTSYHLIPASSYPGVVRWVKQQMGRLRNMASAPAKDPTWHSSKIKAIKARCRNQLGDPEAYKSYIQKYFSASSLTDLATDELQRTHTYIMGKKKPANNDETPVL